jgi:hypothetical protein
VREVAAGELSVTAITNLLEELDAAVDRNAAELRRLRASITNLRAVVAEQRSCAEVVRHRAQAVVATRHGSEAEFRLAASLLVAAVLGPSAMADTATADGAVLPTRDGVEVTP